ncbi:hypothetical protein A3A84_02735 [Candidatus Collierbacteria bacterium RIFCSPLOWO2_01_FULL_50_23]|uniref:Uncharacterized protein n=2 Tax=Candidatus Collieribacteriota TaxID=1752725 RepID=A0A1F5EV78_9BACT|nr:MAG: hypothetical protein A2703_01270 [Candidatus Collierbacteria bacterium RIFCSPHIGHO2_01_FULL_50_25]OGD71298.1 MAG: hypothetical protein A3D09_02720 [Candidatus Collierbacteria bacterium RIFCSPHIGHO2_02_FULL_49_10]OGD74983.1 MAG: hypothetical protein A3A84_02735 [Candidatus Collierbacteria bacterium RIFCSPLOWO2_01_FULL_50_23]
MGKQLNGVDPIFVNIPCPSRDEAIKLCGELLKKELCGTAKIHDHVHLMYTDPDGVRGEDVVLITLKTVKKNLTDIHEFILKNHSWGTPCIEVVPIIADMC